MRVLLVPLSLRTVLASAPQPARVRSQVRLEMLRLPVLAVIPPASRVPIELGEMELLL